ncbi:spinster family MFS transporter [Sphingopyxis terrae]|uniref:Sugar phosphate permease n=2 Tax=Sphingopyxis terrae TaxID=33052 RepID=A0A1Y6ESN5_9SPHN|nr:MFS transporter [Sphingopyxis terrae]SMQ63193.1 Sugar phosphate permease [Sphingopyxis terrae subsp. ummariensis]
MSEKPALALGAGSQASTSVAAKTRTMLWVLLIVYILNFLDRQIVNILAEPIARDLKLSDSDIGLMTGLAFALFYTFLGLPIARYADRPSTNRVGLISVSLAIWSGMTVLCGMAQNFVQLLLARIGVGVGEAGCTPAAHSLITDAVEPAKRSSAIAFYGLGIPIGSLLGLIVGGIVNDLWGWRIAFMVVGVPGLLLAFMVPMFIKEVRARGADTAATTGARGALSIGQALREVFSTRAFVYIAIAASFTAFLGYGKGVWALILFQRSHGLSAGETGLLLGVALGIAGILGTWLGGYFADRFGKTDRRHMLTTPAIGMAVAAPILFLGYAVTEWHVAIALLFVPTVLNAAYYGPTFACVHGLVQPEARAMASAVMLFLQNLIGLGLGPLLFGMASEELKPTLGTESVRYVLYGAAWLGLIPAFFFWRASLRLGKELKSG